MDAQIYSGTVEELGTIEGGCTDLVGDALEWAYLRGKTEDELHEEMACTKSALEDAFNDHNNMVRCCMARLTAMHLARA
jgi:hypothetical protein